MVDLEAHLPAPSSQKGSYLVLVDSFQKTDIGEKEEKEEKKNRKKKRKKREKERKEEGRYKLTELNFRKHVKV